MARRTHSSRPLPAEFLEWQVKLRAFTMEQRNGAPHAGVAPLVTVRRPGCALGVSTHSIICGLLPAPDRLDEKTKEFRQLYEAHVADGARTVYDRGIDYLKDYYVSASDFDAETITTLLHEDSAPVKALLAEPRCSLQFYVFDLVDKSEEGRFRSLQIDAHAEVLREGPVYDNVWWHNTLFHGMADDHVVVHFHHLSTWDTRFGSFEELRS